jgi:hypothetical protein
MKFNIIINKQANFYFFVQNLAEWHFSNRKDYNDLWRKELGKFSLKEEKALEKFREIRKRYRQSRTYFELAFFTTKNPWKFLERNLPTKEYKIVKEIFELFRNKFEKIYKKDLPLLKKWKKVLNKELNNQNFIKSVVKILSKLFNTSPVETNIDVYLLFSSVNGSGGGANINEKSITMEISRLPLDKLNHSLGIMWHEIIHLLFQNNYFYPLLIKQFAQSPADLINEAVNASLFPKGILGIRLLNNESANRLMKNIDEEQTIKILNLTKEYIDNNRSFDLNYIKKIARILKIKRGRNCPTPRKDVGAFRYSESDH